MALMSASASNVRTNKSHAAARGLSYCLVHQQKLTIVVS